MIVGIVGHEAAKFTEVTEAAARSTIRRICAVASGVVSGGCHLGGVDIWAIEEAQALGLPTGTHFPVVREWPGYRARNIQIAESSDVVHVIVVRELPPGYVGFRFKQCYHCKTPSHVKSGGCWTARWAERELGKAANWHIIAPDGTVESQW